MMLDILDTIVCRSKQQGQVCVCYTETLKSKV